MVCRLNLIINLYKSCKNDHLFLPDPFFFVLFVYIHNFIFSILCNFTAEFLFFPSFPADLSTKSPKGEKIMIFRLILSAGIAI